MIISAHAASYEDARAAMQRLAPVVECAARIGCRVVKLGTGQRLLLDRDEVVTVLPKGARV